MKNSRSTLLIAGAVWLLLVSLGFASMNTFAGTAGVPGNAPVMWPADSSIALDPSKLTLVLVLHPKCACSIASVHELARVLEHAKSPVKTYLLFTLPLDADESWRRGAIYQKAAALPDSTVFIDNGSQEAARLGAFTSGQTLLYRPDGTLIFQGGITYARGHEGDNEGSVMLLKTIETFGERPAAETSGNVFGCSLWDPSEAPQ